MGIEQVYAAFCDECEEDFEECFDSHWTSRADLESRLQRSSWKFCDGELLCPTCHADAKAMEESENEGDEVEDDEDEDEEGGDVEDA